MQINNVINHNLQTLLDRERGQKFYVNKEGKLKIISSLKHRLIYFFNRKIIQKGVKNTVSRTISGLKEKQLNTLFFEKLKYLSQKVFDRSAITQDIEMQLAPSIEKTKGYDRKVEEVRFAVKLGIEFEPISEGANGSYFGLNRFGKKLVVFKPSDEDQSSHSNPKWTTLIKKIMKCVFPFLKGNKFIKPRSEYLSEVAASIVDEHLGLNIVPTTKEEEFTSEPFYGEKKTKKGSCQLFEEGAISANQAYGIPSFNGLFQRFYIWAKNGSLLEAVGKEQFDRLVVLDYIIGNLDRHGDNWLAKKRKVVAIDNGLAFGTNHPIGYIATKHQYFWKYLPQAKQQLSPSVKQIVKNINPGELREKLTKIGLDIDQLNTMRERIDVLKKAVLENMIPGKLGNIRTAKQIKNYLN